MGFVLSGMNLGALIAPFLAGAIYDSAGYYAVWIVCLVVVAFNFLLRLIMVEKKTAKKWTTKEVNNPNLGGTEEETDSLLPQESSSESSLDSSSSLSGSESIQREQESYETNESSSLLKFPSKSRESWFRRHFPAMAILLSSNRIRAAVYGCFTHTTLIASFDAVLPLFVKRTFLYTSTGAGLIFLAITIPSTLGTVIGALSDRYGTRAVSLSGFALTTPSLALMGLVTDDSVGHQAALIVLLVAIGSFHSTKAHFQIRSRGRSS